MGTRQRPQSSIVLLVWDFGSASASHLFIPHIRWQVWGGEDAASFEALIPSELFLLEPALRARAREGGVLEQALVAAWDRFLPPPSAATAAAPPPPPPAQIERAPAGSAALVEVQDTTAPDAAAAASGGAVSRGELLAVWSELCGAFPGLRDDPHTFLGTLGLPPQALYAARGALAGGGAGAMQAALRIFEPDRTGWEDVRAAVRALCAGPPPLPPPTMQSLLAPGNPWYRVSSAVLGCSAVKLSPLQRAALTQSALAKERRELREQQNRALTESAPKVH